MSSIEGVILDVGGVFLLPQHGPVLDALARLSVPSDLARVDRAHYAGMAALDAAGPDMALWGDAYRRAYVEALGVPEERRRAALDEVFREGSPWTRVRSDCVDALRALAQLAIPIAIVSNADGTVGAQLQALGVCQVGPGPGVEVVAVIDSGAVGVAKPDPRIFEFALGAIGVRADRTVYVGDSVRIDVEGARAAGIRPLHFDPYRLCGGDDHEDIGSLHEVVQVTRAGRR